MGKNVPVYAIVDITTAVPWPVKAWPNAYKAEVTTTDNLKLYHGTSNGEFKTRFNKHTKLFSNKKYSTDTELSKYI